MDSRALTIRLLLFGAGLIALMAVWAFSFISKRYEAVAAGVLPVASVEYPSLTLVTVGSGGTFENHRRRGPAAVVGHGTSLLLVDAGRGVSEALRAAAIPVAQPTMLLLTSLLPENTLGLDDLLLTRALTPDTPPLAVRGPAGTRALADGLLQAHASGIAAARASGLADYVEVEARDVAPGEVVRLGEIEARPVALSGTPLPALAWRIEAAGRALLVSSLGADPDALVEHGRDADLWLHDALYGAAIDVAIEQGAERPEVLRAEAEWHTRLEDVGGLARRMGVATLVLARLRPPPVYDFQYRGLIEDFDGQVVIARDGLVLAP